jgi:hypothetical protein
MEEGKKNENNVVWRPELLANSIVRATVCECLLLRMGQTVSALMSHIKQNRLSELTFLV